MKKIVGIVVLLMMTLVLTVSNTKVEAAESKNAGTITIINDPTVTGIELASSAYNAYKVFDLELIDHDEDGKVDGYNYTIDKQFESFFIAKAKVKKVDVGTTEKFNDFAYKYVKGEYGESITEVAKELNSHVNAQKIIADGISGTVIKESDKVQKTTITNLPLGYYLVLDNQVVGEGAVIAAAALGSTDTHLEINLKASKPTVDKEIQHNENGEWGNVGDNQIGEAVNYRLTSTLPTSVTGYDSYTYKLHDTLSAGLTFNNNVQIKVLQTDGNGVVTETELDTAYYKVDWEVGEQSFSITVDVLKGVTDEAFNLGDKLIVEYSATLNENAVVAGDSNDNEVYLEYSNNPSDENSKDKTPTVTVKDYTFKLNVLKTQGDASTALAGATFKLFEGNTALKFKLAIVEGVNQYTLCANQLANDCTEEMVSPENGKFSIVGLDDATEYTLKEVQAPTGFIPMKPITFTITAEYNEDGTPKLISTNVGGITQVDNTFELGTTVVNMPGIELPETGGIGTVIFKVLGAALMVSGVLLVIYKRRLN